ncbi:MAG TPA: sigma-E factor negative regulatory protein [Xanthomonadaceae bacterium]|nr:sigma-E factor negative regulatory protein [Xanthomonadaceae bacterium]
MNHPNDKREEDKILDHTRRQLSALVDGELAPDEARFLLRRLEHDAELAGCWERWQLAGELLRGRGGAVLPTDFAARIAVAVAGEAAPVAPAARQRRWLHWGGGAIAASVALVALLMARPAGEPGSTPSSAPTPALASNAPASPAPAQPAPTQPAPLPPAPDTAGQLATAVAAAEVPRRVAAARRGNAQAQRAAARLRERREAPVAVAAAAVEPARVADPHNPFSPDHVLPPSRPWPRALVPGMGAEGGFTVEYGGQAPAPGFYPFAPGVFQPRRGLAPLPEPPGTARADAGETDAP